MSEQLQLRRGTSTQVAAFTGAQGETVMDTTNNRLVVSDGTTAGGWPAAKLAEVITNGRTAVTDTACTALTTDRLIAYATLTAARIVSLPAASTYPTGTRLLIVDETGNCSTTKTLTITPNGTDAIDGATSAVINTLMASSALKAIRRGLDDVDQGFMPALSYSLRRRMARASNWGARDPCHALRRVDQREVQIPANCIVLAVGARVVTAITGATSYEVGVSGSLSQFGSGFSVSAGSTNYGLIGPTAFYSATTLTIAATGGSFTGGQVRLSIAYMLANPSAA